MAYKDLQGFISILEEKKQLKSMSAKVSSDLEIAEIIDRILKRQNIWKE